MQSDVIRYPFLALPLIELTQVSGNVFRRYYREDLVDFSKLRIQTREDFSRTSTLGLGLCLQR